MEKLENGTAPLIEGMDGGLETCEEMNGNAGEDTYLDKISVQMVNVSAKWSDQLSENTLNNVNITINSGSSFAIIGPVGSGKVRWK